MRENESSQMEYANWKAPDMHKQTKQKGIIDAISEYIPGTAAYREATEKASPLMRRVVALQEGITALEMRKDIIQVDKDKMLDWLRHKQSIAIELLDAVGNSKEKIARLTERREPRDSYMGTPPEVFMEKMEALALERGGAEEGRNGAEAA